MQQHPGSLFRQLLARGGAVPVPGCYDPLGAMLIERAGFDAAYMTGFSLSASYGKPDIGLLTMQDMVQQAQRIAESVRIPVIMDADTGYGGAANIAETVRACDKAGLAGLHLEDQLMPKKCGAMAGKQLASIEEMQLRLKAARSGRVHRDFVIIGRTDAMTVAGLEEVLLRCKAMQHAGADAIMVPSLSTPEELAAVAASVEIPVLYVAAETVRPTYTKAQLEQAGFAAALYPLSLIQTTVKVQQAMLQALHQHGDSVQLIDGMLPFAELGRLVGVERAAAFESWLNSSSDLEDVVDNTMATLNGRS
ncbi:methylisocitrate lyase [Herbaspirillum sp. Sphag1AN]|uniref:isocitrate lyase/PEP mutase family protein n=1 Tax=unclassified Herbaspirillum TaxID=2624150 RepID=UPI0016073C46|nr:MULTISPECIES: isocitrate lyase/PEP mutase family protein [unclassified Herbaspirillum]MBB3212937.1 methylisocitrate lyase [Herbaspirillum sp. Sphag1AN]MBB3246134.1 methylisocitrate lyase [Herbaspirillum sp. Sphag64]